LHKGDEGPETVATRLAAVCAGIESAARRAHRAPDDVELVAVTKYAAADAVVALAGLGQRRFGENRLQEATARIDEVNRRVPEQLEWHMIGHLQTNKVKQAIGRFAMIETVDSRHLASTVSRRATFAGLVIPVLIEVNIAGDPAKHGLTRTDALRDYPELCGLPGLDVEGLMTVPPEPGRAEDSRPHFAALRDLKAELDSLGVARPMRHLSMGMSADFEVAIEEGATIVRVGTALFGSHHTA
jgi:pyridoxal phosphate enzyme (YggS family)